MCVLCSMFCRQSVSQWVVLTIRRFHGLFRTWAGQIIYLYTCSPSLSHPYFRQLQLLQETQWQCPSNLMEGKCCFVYLECLQVLSDLNRWRKERWSSFGNLSIMFGVVGTTWINMGMFHLGASTGLERTSNHLWYIWKSLFWGRTSHFLL